MITEELIAFLNDQTERVGLPQVMVDMVATGESISLQTITQPQVVKSYINGSRLLRYSFRLMRKSKAERTSSSATLGIIKSLDALAALFGGMDDFNLSDDIIIESAEASTTSIVAREDTGLVVYGVTINLVYKEI